MPHKRDPVRSIRCGDGLWAAAKRAVKKRGDHSVSHIIRGYLAQYIDEADEWIRPMSGRRQGPSQPPTRGANLERDDEG